MKKLFVAVAAMLLLFTFHKSEALESMVETELAVSSPSIVMVDNIILLVDTGNVTETVQEIKIYSQDKSQLLSTIAGCNQKSCNNDISHLGAGTYWVVVTTSANSVFRDFATIQ